MAKGYCVCGIIIASIFGVAALVLLIIGGVEKSASAGRCETNCWYDHGYIESAEDDSCCAEEVCYYDSNGSKSCYCVRWEDCCQITCHCMLNATQCVGKLSGRTVNSSRTEDYTPWGTCSEFHHSWCDKNRCDLSDTDPWNCWISDTDFKDDGAFETWDYNHAKIGIALLATGGCLLLPFLIGAVMILYYVYDKTHCMRGFFNKLFAHNSSSSSSSSSSISTSSYSTSGSTPGAYAVGNGPQTTKSTEMSEIASGPTPPNAYPPSNNYNNPPGYTISNNSNPPSTPNPEPPAYIQPSAPLPPTNNNDQIVN